MLTELPDVALEHLTEELKVLAAARNVYEPFISALHPVIPSQIRSGKLRDRTGDSERKEGDGANENAGKIPAGRYSRRTFSSLLGTVSRQTKPPSSHAERMTPLLTGGVHDSTVRGAQARNGRENLPRRLEDDRLPQG